jgi:large subunit ribosomal protein L21
MFAVIKTGGKQYLVKEGQTLNVELLKEEAGAKIEFNALLVADEKGEDVKLGAPTVAGAKVSATVVEDGKAKKVSVIKYKPKVRYRRNVGHRQPFTKIQIEKITLS